MWIEIQIDTHADAAELVAAAVAPITGGVEMRDSETVLPTAPDRSVVIALCAPEQRDELLAAVEETLALAREAGSAVDPVAIRERAAHEDEWRDKWKQFFRAQPIGRRFIVRPSWDQGTVPDGEHVIDLDPGRAFGTGAHPSTRLVIRFMEDLADRGFEVRRFLDLGCGSGILSIAAARLWPGARGLGVDVDDESAACSRENFALNRVTTVEARAGSVDAAEGRFDLVLANIQADVLETLAPAIRTRVGSGGRLALSGLLTPQVAGIEVVYVSAGFSVDARGEEGEWGSLLLAPR